MTLPKPRRVLRLPQVIEKAAHGRDSTYRGGRESWFPKHIKLTERASGWFEDEIDDFLARRAAERAPMAWLADQFPPGREGSGDPKPWQRRRRLFLKRTGLGETRAAKDPDGTAPPVALANPDLQGSCPPSESSKADLNLLSKPRPYQLRNGGAHANEPSVSDSVERFRLHPVRHRRDLALLVWPRLH